MLQNATNVKSTLQQNSLSKRVLAGVCYYYYHPHVQKIFDFAIEKFSN